MSGEVVLQDSINPQDKERVQREMAELKKGDKVEVSYGITKADGTSGWVTETRQLTEKGYVIGSISDNMPVLEIVAGSVAHEFNNAFTPIRGYAEFANLAHPSEDLETVMQEIDKAAAAVANLIQMQDTGQVKLVDGHPNLLDLKSSKDQQS